MQKQYRIFHLIKSLGRGGAEVLLIETLRHSNHDRFLFSYGYFLPFKDAIVQPLQDAGADVVCFNCKNVYQILRSTRKIEDYIRSWKADLIHCHLPIAGVVGRVAGRNTGIPVVYTEHNVMERYHPWTRRLNLWTWKWQQAVIAVSGEVKTSIDREARSSVPVRIIQNGIPLESFVLSSIERQRIRELYGIPQSAIVVGTIAVFRPQKDLKNWLKAALAVRRKFPQTHFLIVGDGVLKNEIHSAAAELGLKDICHFTGLQESVSPFYSAMDIYFNSSIFEGLPLTILEAMAMQLPVIATRVGGIPEVVEDGVTGYLVAPGESESAASKIEQLITKPDQRSEFGKLGRKRIEERFSMQRMAKDLESLYAELIERRTLVN